MWGHQPVNVQCGGYSIHNSFTEWRVCALETCLCVRKEESVVTDVKRFNFC